MENLLTKLQDNISNVLIGKEEAVELLAISICGGGHVLMEDVPGTGKTMMSKALARSIDGRFRRIQMTPDVLPGDVTGIQFYNPKTQDFETKPGPVMTNILLTDEINRATPKTQSSLLEAMEEHQVTIEGETLRIPSPFLVIATQNPIESQGTFPLPEAQMDRFFMKINVGYPSLDQEKEMMRIHREGSPEAKLEPVLSLDDVIAVQEKCKDIKLSEDVENYLLAIINATRSSDLTETGVSPRGTLAFMRAVQARAYLHNRSYVTPDDIKYLAPYVLAHRLVLTMEAEMHGNKEQAMHKVLESIEAPVEAGAVSE